MNYRMINPFVVTCFVYVTISISVLANHGPELNNPPDFISRIMTMTENRNISLLGKHPYGICDDCKASMLQDDGIDLGLGEEFD